MKALELTSREQQDLHLAVVTRIGRIEDLLTIPGFKEDKAYKDELARMVILNNKLKYNG